MKLILPPLSLGCFGRVYTASFCYLFRSLSIYDLVGSSVSCRRHTCKRQTALFVSVPEENWRLQQRWFTFWINALILTTELTDAFFTKVGKCISLQTRNILHPLCFFSGRIALFSTSRRGDEIRPWDLLKVQSFYKQWHRKLSLDSRCHWNWCYFHAFIHLVHNHPKVYIKVPSIKKRLIIPHPDVYLIKPSLLTLSENHKSDCAS